MPAINQRTATEKAIFVKNAGLNNLDLYCSIFREKKL